MPLSALDQAAACLPAHLRERVYRLPAAVKERTEELRLRVDRAPTAILPEGECCIPGAPLISGADLSTVLELASRHSVHAALEHIQNGFLTVRGGHRLGLAGEATVEQGRVKGFRSLNSVNLRIARAIRGAAAEIAPKLFFNGSLQSTLIIASPGAGKTTLLRDLVRTVSEGEGTPALQVGLVDERGEVAALWEGRPQMDVGRRTDVLDGIPKAEGMLFLLRGMAPRVLAVDEITHPEDVHAIRQAAGCGVPILATVHGSCAGDLLTRPVFRSMLRSGVFRLAVTLHKDETGKREGKVEELLCFDWQAQLCSSPPPPRLD